MKKLVILDLDGTLVDTKADIIRSLNTTLVERNLPAFPESAILEYVGYGIAPLIQKTFSAELAPVIIEEFLARYAREVAVESRLYPGWDLFFKDFPEVAKVVLTNKPQPHAEALMRELDIARFFNAIYGRGAFAENKPSPVPIQQILRMHLFSGDQALIVGDMDSDIIAGQRAGIETCAVLFGYGRGAELLDLKPTFSISSVGELLELLR